MSTNLSRRQFLSAAGLVTGTVLSSSFINLPAQASEPTHNGPFEPLQGLDDGWRHALALDYLHDPSTVSARPLQDGIELWESTLGGYMIVDSSSQTSLESSATAASPYSSIHTDAAFLGPGQYYALGLDAGVNLRDGDSLRRQELRAIAADASMQIHELAEPEVPRVAARASNGLVSVKASEVRARVSNYTYITNATLYENTSGTCGWIAGSIITRYWHARSAARKLLPSKFRSGTNMTFSPILRPTCKTGKLTEPGRAPSRINSFGTLTSRVSSTPPRGL